MKIEFTGRQTEVPPEVRRLVERKVQKLARVLPGLTRAHVILASDKHRQIAEVSIHSRNLDLSAQEASRDLGLSVSNVMDKLLRQVQRYLGRRRERKGGASPRTMGGDSRGAAEGPRVIRSRRFPVKPMTLDEAALEVGARNEGFLVFRDAETERVNVLYRRKDGHLGLIEPEA
jgi:putative sigma-54 modulation protein